VKKIKRSKMKKLLLGFGLLMSISAFASGTYICDISVFKDGESIGKIKIEQQFGMSAGRLYTIPVSKKKNIFGKTVEEVEVVLSGVLQSGSDAADSSLEGDISVIKTTIKRNIKTEKTLITNIIGSGDLAIKGIASGYAVSGSCVFKN
jgi:hypothetical protein